MNKRNRSTKTKRSRAAALTRPHSNKKYKDTVFRMLFKDKKNLLKLYNAVNKTNYTDVNGLSIVTLESAIYLGYKNDMAFLIGDFLNLYEHQSTYNPNMPLRMLLYVASEYQVLMENRSLYSSVLQKIPTPRFVIFYNGRDKQIEVEVQLLSKAFAVPMDDPELELKVTLYNINEGHNQELMKQCQILSEYAEYVARVRRYAVESSIQDAVHRAVDECIEEGILAEFLSKNKVVVVKMSIFEYDKEKEEAKYRRAEFEAGREAERKNTEKERKKAEAERQKAEAERKKAEVERQKAEAERQKAEDEKKERIKLEQENEQLKRLIQQLKEK